MYLILLLVFLPNIPANIYFPKVPVLFLIAFAEFGIHHLILYERFLKEKKYKEYILGFITLWFSYCLINLYTPFGIVHGGPGIIIAGTFFVYVFGMGFYFIHKYVIERNLIFRQQLVGKEEEIRYLKSQLNPHFLFNALNNLYGIALSTPLETADKILELSELLRYQIESSQKEYADLKDELHYLKQYFSYELNRNPKLVINYKLTGEAKDIRIAPFLWMPFIENAVKFSAETDAPVIDIDLRIDKRTLYFIIGNDYDSAGRKLSGTQTGVINTKKRLDLMYEKKHTLNIHNANNRYEVKLILQI